MPRGNSPEEVVGLLQGQIAEVLAYATAVARRMDLNLSEVAALEHLGNAGALTPSQLGGRLRITSGAVTALVDRLERAGYLKRRPNPNDRRSSVLSLKPSGVEAAKPYLAPLASDLLVVASELSKGERASVCRFLGSVTDTVALHARGGG